MDGTWNTHWEMINKSEIVAGNSEETWRKSGDSVEMGLWPAGRIWIYGDWECSADGNISN